LAYKKNNNKSVSEYKSTDGAKLANPYWVIIIIGFILIWYMHKARWIKYVIP